MKRALITGITGQDGSYLAELLLAKDYEVFGMIRQHPTANHPNIERLKKNPRLKLLVGDMNDVHSLIQVLHMSEPNEVYNLAAQSFVGHSWQQADYTLRTNAVAVENLLSAIRIALPLSEQPKFYQASSSEMYGNGPGDNAIDLSTPFKPCSPYGVAKLAAHHTAINYRETYDMFVCCGILFNHESPRRGMEFVTQKIATGLARLKACVTAERVKLGNINSKRDWGYAPDYVYAMWLMLQHPKPQDYIIGTGVTSSVKEFVFYCMNALNLPLEDFGSYVTHNWLAHTRPNDLNCLVADPSFAKEQLGWQPIVQVEDLARCMCDAALKRIERETKYDS